MKTRLLILATQVLAVHLAWATEAPQPAQKFSWNLNGEVRSGYRTAPWVRDPFFKASSLKLTGIISGKLAYVDGRWVGRGDKVGDYTVSDITAHSVRLVNAVNVLVLKLSE